MSNICCTTERIETKKKEQYDEIFIAFLKTAQQLLHRIDIAVYEL